MLLPEKHISLAESILGLGAIILDHLDRPRSVDQLYQAILEDRENGTLPAFHDFDAVILAVVFLFSIGAVEANSSGVVSRCVS